MARWAEDDVLDGAEMQQMGRDWKSSLSLVALGGDFLRYLAFYGFAILPVWGVNWWA
jgi:hypothetical protein